MHRVIKALDVQLLHGCADILHIAFEHRAQHLVRVDLGGHFEALHGGQPVADQFLQGALQLRVAFIAQHRGKAHDRGFAHAHALAQSAGRHEHSLVVMLDDILGDLPVPLAQPAA